MDIPLLLGHDDLVDDRIGGHLIVVDVLGAEGEEVRYVLG